VNAGPMARELEPVLRRVVAAEQHGEAVAAVDWSAFRACPVCRVAIGAACRSASGRVVGGQPDGISTALEHPHVARKRRAGR
jgi:hypothetical protein